MLRFMGRKELDTTERLNWTEGFMGFPGGLDGKESISNAGDLGPITGLGRSPQFSSVQLLSSV